MLRNKLKSKWRRCALIFLIFQTTTITTFYYLSRKDHHHHKGGAKQYVKVSFLTTNSKNKPKMSYYTATDTITLPTVKTKRSFIDFNSSLCYVQGSDLKSMDQTGKPNWQCRCLPGWHGIDCGQPEVIWRTLLTHREIKIRGPKSIERRIVYLFRVDPSSEIMADMRINELSEVVDLFVLYEDENSTFLEQKLNNEFIRLEPGRRHRIKILYLRGDTVESLWNQTRRAVKNLRNDDLILSSRRQEILNKSVLRFLRSYDGFKEPLRFRLRWSVFGFFWIHPGKTIIRNGAVSVSRLKNASTIELNSLLSRSAIKQERGVIFGDLNHYGGWYCEYCTDTAQIVNQISDSRDRENEIEWERIQTNKIDEAYIEDLIENGLYIDGKTQLIRSYRSRESYFAPEFVSNHDGDFEFLMKNYYSKIDY